MSTLDVHTVCNNLETLFKKEWMNRPTEIKELESRKGAWDSTFGVHIYCHFETLEVVEFVWTVRTALIKGRLPLEAAKSFLGTALIEKSTRMTGYYKFKEYPDALNQVGLVVQKVASKEEFIKVIDMLRLYIDRYNYWLDADLNWKELSDTHDRLREGSRQSVFK
jgi:hypothetical protein